MTQGFPQFGRLPLELRQNVWGLAAASWTQDIHFSLSKSKILGWEWSPDRYPGRKHIFATELAVPPLLYACHDSREVALKHYSLGLDIEASNENGRPPRNCSYHWELEEVATRTYWAPDNDVIVLEHGGESFACGNCAKDSTAPFQRQEYTLDKRTKYLAITMDVWNRGSGTITIDVPALEVLFVIVDKKPSFPLGGSGGLVELDTLESRQKESRRVLEAQMNDAVRSDAAVFKLKREAGRGITIDIEIVEDLDELVQRVGERRAAAELRKASNTA